MLLVLGFATAIQGIGHAQVVVTGNAFASAQVQENNGLITLWSGQPPPVGDNGLTFPGESFLTVEVNGVYYTYNPNVGPASTPPAVDLNFPDASHIKDTVRCIWKEEGFDIVQDVWPVQFANSGVIVISVKIVNHSSNDLPVQAQFLLDNENSTASNANDNPDIITNNGYLTNSTFSPIFQTCPPNPLPSFDLTFQNHPSAVNLLTVGAGYFDNTYTPSPIGLIPPSLVQFGYWPTMQGITFGPSSGSPGFTDDATLIMGPSSDASSALSGDSVTEIFRTAYGTPEWCYDHGQIVGVAMYPNHITWDQATLSYSPNPFQVQTFLFADNDGTAGNTTIRQTAGNPIHITTPKPTGATNNDTTQQQIIGTIEAGGVAIVNWTDSVIVMPAGCPSNPVDIHFSVATNTAAGDSLTFVDNPWGCPIDVDCAHPDITPPKFHNSFAGCDSIEHDTVTVHDDTLYDTGLKDVTYTSPNLTPTQYSVTINPPPPYNCIDTSAKIFVRQVDTAHSGNVVFAFTDCAGNVSMDTICFTQHLPIPDRTPPRFWNDSYADSCHQQCQRFTITDSARSDTSIDRGLDSLVIDSAVNMTLQNSPGVRFWYAPGVLIDSNGEVCVTDSLKDGIIILRANDTSHNFSFDTITYCTTPDTHPPVVTVSSFVPSGNSYPVLVTDSQSWDRGVDSVWLEDTSNVLSVPDPIPNPLGCLPAYTFFVKVLDTSQCASAMVYAQDCAGHVTGPVPINFTKGAIPVIVASKTTLCSASDSATLDAGTGYTGYLWTSGQTTEKVTVGAGTYSVTVQEGSGCPATSQPETIILSPATPQITPPGPLAICTPGTETLDAGAGFATYQWLRDGNVMPDTSSETVIIGSTGNYTVQVTNAAGCSGTSQPVTVTINPLPSVPVISSVNTVLTATSATPNVTYQWSRNGATVPGATSQTVIDSTGGSYTVTVTDANGCSSTSQPFSTSGTTLICVSSMVQAEQSNQVTIPLTVCSSQASPSGNLNFTVKIAFNKTLLVPNGSPSGGNLVGTSLSGNGDSLIVEYTGIGSAASGTTLLNLPFIAALGNDSCTAVTIDSFAWNAQNITVTTQNGNFCLSNVCYQGGPQLINPNGTVSLSDPIPNPSNNSIEIGYSLIEQGQTTLILYDLLGHEVLRMVDAAMPPGTYTVVADVSALPAGTYVYSLRTPTIVMSNHLQISR
jgi:hypothetical protein